MDSVKGVSTLARTFVMSDGGLCLVESNKKRSKWVRQRINSVHRGAYKGERLIICGCDHTSTNPIDPIRKP